MSAREPDDRIVITFREPIVVGNVTYASVTLTEPIGEQLEAVEHHGGGWAGLRALITANGCLPPDVTKKMRQRDLAKAADFFAAFGSERSTGSGSATSSESSGTTADSTPSPRS